ncbi:MAG: hypothetical protein HYW48_06790 [Deltaproteobacteria bacterium]|nr:hypothetical protein [Deltaproteobacteria bacterium]
MFRHFLALAFFLSSFAAFAENVTLEVKESWENNRLTLRFTVHHKQGTKLNLDAPWKLLIEGEAAGCFPERQLGRQQFSSDLPGFVLTSGPLSGPSLKVPYKLMAYSCLLDGSSCFRDVVAGEFIATKPSLNR